MPVRIGGEVYAAIVLWVLGIILTIAGLAPLGGAEQWVWLPWQIDGVWALVGAIGWGYLVCTLVAWLVSDRIARRGYQPPEAAWLRISIAISGYGAMAVGRTAGAHIAGPSPTAAYIRLRPTAAVVTTTAARSSRTSATRPRSTLG